MSRKNPAQEAVIAKNDATQREAREAQRRADLAACETDVRAVLEKYGAQISAVRIVRVQPDGTERTQYTVEISIPQ